MIITCDRQNNLIRAAVWQGRELVDLYLDNLDNFDLTGAIVGGKAARLLPKQNAAYFDCGLDEPVFVEGATNIRSGDYKVLSIKTAKRQGKAWGGAISNIKQDNEQVGIIVPPHAPWQRAINDLKETRISSIIFENRDDYKNCKEWIDCCAQKLATSLKPISKEPIHPQLDDIIDNLRVPFVNISGGGNIYIEQTEALVAIDVNSGEGANPLATNLLAVKEAARQIRLRNISGIIIIDALKMKLRPDKAKIINAIEKASANDPAGVQIFGMTKLGLIELTRKRRGYSLMEII